MNGGEKKRAYKRRISAKIVRYFLIVSILPVGIVGVVLMERARSQMYSDATVRQQSLATDASTQVSRHIDAYINQLSLIAHLNKQTTESVEDNLTALVQKTAPLSRVEYFDGKGKKRIAEKSSGNVSYSVASVGSTDETLDTLMGESSKVTVTRTGSDSPVIAIGMSLGERLNARADGAIIGYFNLDETWKHVLPSHHETSSYVYVVDESSKLIHHPDRSFLRAHTELGDVKVVENFMVHELSTVQAEGETGSEAISAVRATTHGWGVIATEPVSSALAGMTIFTNLALATTIGALVVSVMLGLAFAGRIALPLRRLVKGARNLASNNLTEPINVKSQDELQELADIFNALGVNINKYVTDLQTNNENLSFEQSRLRSIIDSVNDGVIAVDRKGVIISANGPAMQLLNNTEYSVVGRDIREVYTWTHDNEPLVLDFTSAGFSTIEDVVLAKSEAVAYLDIKLEVLDRTDSDVAAIITTHDQTATRELNFLKLDFVAIAAHELRTPLTVINGYLDMLNREAIHKLSADSAEDLQRVIVGAQQLGELINKLLNVARIARGDMEIHLTKLNLTQLVSLGVQEHQQIATQHKQTLTYQSTLQHDVEVPADAASVVEVLNNLMGNAMKYTPEGGQILVQLSATATEARVDIIDNGPGVPEDMRDKLFSKFYRAERTGISGIKGTGLGLFISKTIIELQHGTIGVMPDKGTGSNFYFTLPIYNAERDDPLVMQNISRGKHGWYKKRPNN
jgi:signal transduction histidine kinase